MPGPLIITVAPNGARRSRADHPALPLTPDDLANTAAECLEAGAAMIHLHVRDERGRHVLDAARFRAACARIRAAVGSRLLLQVTTEADGRYTPAEQTAMVRELGPESVSLALREFVPDDSSEAAAAEFFEWLSRREILAQYILYSAAELTRFYALQRRGIIPADNLATLWVLGSYGAAGADVTPRDLLPYIGVHDRERALPSRALAWSVCAFGPKEAACVIAGANFGGHVRVGFENNICLADGTIAPSNAALVRQLSAVAAVLGRPLADATAARRLLV